MSLDNSKIFQETTCFINNEEKTGQVLSIATYGDGRQIVCFREEGEHLGKWVPIVALSGAASDSVSKREAVSSTPPVADKKKTKTDSSPKEKVEVEVMLSSEEEEKIEAEVEKDINELEKLVNDIKASLGKTTSTTISMASFFWTASTTTIATALTTTSTTIVGGSTSIISLLDAATKGVDKFVKDLLNRIASNWNLLWKDRILSAINANNANEARKVVQKIKESFPHFDSKQIAEFLINEKALFSTLAGIASAIPVVGQAVDLSATTKLLIELVYEIACAYEQDIKSPEAIHEILAILALSCTLDNLPKIGLGFLLKQHPITSWAISPTINVILFLGVGYAACQYYEAKLSGKEPLSAETYQHLQAQVNSYFGELMTEGEKVKEIVSKAIPLQEKLPATI